MDIPERGPAIEYEVVWKTGHIDRFKAHQVSHTGGFNVFLQGPPKPERIDFHGEFDGRWQLVLSAPVDDISVVRNLSQCGDQL